MNIILPIAGKGERFIKEGYKDPKPLIRFYGKCIIEWVLESLELESDDVLILLYTCTLDKYHFEEYIRHHVRKLQQYHVYFVRIPYQTQTVVETLHYGFTHLPPGVYDKLCQRQTVTLDGDTFYTENIIEVIRSCRTNGILYRTNTSPEPLFSYIMTDETDIVVDISEKCRVSDKANIGVYIFETLQLLSEYCHDYTLKPQEKEIYISDIYQSMLKDGHIIHGIFFDKVICLGTPLQLQFQQSSFFSSTPHRVCVDLDNTLVSYPRVEGDYRTVEPYQDMIDFVTFLKKVGCTIIIYTARRMKTHKSNIGKVMMDIGKITLETLEAFDIPFDEIYFGKPDADFYIDDRAFRPVDNLEYQTGYYQWLCKPRSFHTLETNQDTITKTSHRKEILGEIYWYQHIPLSLQPHFPQLYHCQTESPPYSITMEKIRGLPLSFLWVHQQCTPNLFDKLLTSIHRIHNTKSSCPPFSEEEMYDVYTKKIQQRYQTFDYSSFSKSDEMYEWIIHHHQDYVAQKRGTRGVIHGDAVFSNVLVDEKQERLVWIDMRGRIQESLTIYGDVVYDYAKIYQSLLGYDCILNNQMYDMNYATPYIHQLQQHVTIHHGSDIVERLPYLTMGLFFSLLPLHDPQVQARMWVHLLFLYESMFVRKRKM